MVAIFPVVMLVRYLILLFYLRARDGYTVEVLAPTGTGDKPKTSG
jgi:hypothetical protein